MILSETVSSVVLVKASADMFDKICAQGYICTVGSEAKIAENAEMFDTLVVIK